MAKLDSLAEGLSQAMLKVLTGPTHVALVVKNPPANAGDLRDTGLIPGLGRSPEGGHGKPTPVFLPGESPWREEPGGLQFMGSQRTGHD